MKKTFITAALCVGFAASASAVSLSDAVAGFSAYNESTNADGLTLTTSEGFNYYTGKTFSSLSGSQNVLTFAITFDSNKLDELIGSTQGDWSYLISVSGENASGVSDSIGLALMRYNNNIVVQARDEDGNVGNNTSVWGRNLYTNADGKTALVIALNSGGLTPYSPTGVSAGAITNTRSGSTWSNPTNYTFDTLRINDALTPAIEQVYVFDHDYLTTNAASLYTAMAEVTASKAIPEPATASLSLLALAGLAARRRRK